MENSPPGIQTIPFGEGSAGGVLFSRVGKNAEAADSAVFSEEPGWEEAVLLVLPDGTDVWYLIRNNPDTTTIESTMKTATTINNSLLLSNPAVLFLVFFL